MKVSAAVGLVAVATLTPTVTAVLSVGNTSNTTRADEILATASAISIVDRTFLVGNTSYPINPGPELVVPSLYYSTLVSQVTTILELENPNGTAIEALLQELGPYSTTEDFTAAYEAVEAAGLNTIPTAIDNSDTAYGAVRLGLRGYNIKIVRGDEYAQHLDELSTDLVQEICNEASIADAIANHKVFVEDFDGLGKFTDVETVDTKYAPDVVGFFCNNDASGDLLPLAIHLPGTGLTYTKEDSAGEWQVAKMALDATELNFQPMFHLVTTHMVSIPIQVEMWRSMSPEHPIYALLNYHFFCDMGLEYVGGTVLFSVDTPFDQSMAFGASGSMRFVYSMFSNFTVSYDHPTEMNDTGLSYLPKHRLVKYGDKYYAAIKEFVTSYVKAYYTSEEAVQQDPELQTWAARSSAIWGVNDFPSSFSSYDDLIKIVTHLIFQNAVKHHFMNGRESWHNHAAPFSSTALYNTPLPTEKGVEVNPADYFIPSDIFPLMAYMVVRFFRPIPDNYSALQAYTTSPFTTESVLDAPIATFHAAMDELEDFVLTSEANETYPYDWVRPSIMPWFSYI
jgi:hypothetical protein